MSHVKSPSAAFAESPRPASDAATRLFQGTRSSTPRSFYGSVSKKNDAAAAANTPTSDANEGLFRGTSSSTPRSFYGSVSKKEKPASSTPVGTEGTSGSSSNINNNNKMRRVILVPSADELDTEDDDGDWLAPLLLSGIDCERIGSTRSRNRDVFDYDGLVKRFELFRRVIEHEDDLLNQRVSWIILAQSFLMAAFITANNNASAHPAFLYATASVGLATVLVTLPALVAAGRNIEVQQDIYFEGLPSDAVCQALHGHDRDRGWRAPGTSPGATSSHLLPNIAFRSRFGVPILVVVVLLSVVQVAGWCYLLAALAMYQATDDDA